MKTRIAQSIGIIALTVAAVVYGWLMLSDSSPICWQKYPDEPCKTSGEIISNKLFGHD